jgi:hypothetical protein
VTIEATQDEPIALFAHNQKAHVLYPDYKQSAGSALTYAAVEPGDTGNLDVGQPITGESKMHRQPSAIPTDNDEMLVVWARGAKDDPSIVADRTELGSPSDLSGQVIRSEADNKLATGPMVANGDKGAGTVFAQRNGMDTKYAPLSINAVPICN